MEMRNKSGAVQEMTVTTCQSQSESCETLSQCETEVVAGNVSQLTLGEKRENTYYGVSLLPTHHHKHTEDKKQQFCVKTKVGLF